MSAATFADRLRALRTEAKLTQDELATRSGLHRMVIAKLENGQRRPAWETLLALAEALDVSLDAFKDAPEPPPAKAKRKPRK